MISNPHKLALNSDRNEIALLSSMLQQPSACHNTIAFGITEEDFFDCRNKAIFSLIRERMDEHKAIDYAPCFDEAMRRELCASDYFAEVFSFCTGGYNWKEYCQILREYTVARRALTAGTKIAEAASDPGLVRDIAMISRELIGALDIMAPKQEVSFADQVDHALDTLESDVQEERFGFGILDLDSNLKGGALKGNFVVVAGDTGRGKSILLAMAALEALMHNRSLAYYSLEMPEDEVILRLGASLMRRPMVRKTSLQTPGDRQAAQEARQILHAAQAYLRCDMIDIDEIVNDARSRKPDVVVVDYIQIADCKEGDNRAQNVSAISRKLKQLSSSGCVVFAASQVNDEGKVFDSRAINHNANITIAIEEHQGSPRLRILKNRAGRSNVTIPVTLNGDISRFE